MSSFSGISRVLKILLVYLQYPQNIYHLNKASIGKKSGKPVILMELFLSQGKPGKHSEFSSVCLSFIKSVHFQFLLFVILRVIT